MRRGKHSAILLSRQSMYPTGAAEWVMAAKQAVLWAKENNYRILAAVHAPTWELVLSLASILDIPITIVVASDSNFETNKQKKLFDDFDLLGRDVQIVSVHTENKATKENICANVDMHIVQLADILLPVSIRRRGSWEKMLASLQGGDKSANESFRMPYSSRTVRIKKEYEKKTINPDIKILGSDFLFHWTRAASRPWPTERPIDFYRAIIESTVYPRTAFDTLRNILTTGIAVSSRHMPKGISTVSFSALPPAQVIPLMRWRQRYREMSFEPYAIGIRKEAALRAGIKPVEYFERGNLRKLESADDRWRLQSIGVKTDWRQEAEYRYPGDIPLNQFTASDRVIIVSNVEEAATLSASCNERIMPLFVD